MEIKRNDKKKLKRRGEMGDIYRHRKYNFFVKHPPTAILIVGDGGAGCWG